MGTQPGPKFGCWERLVVLVWCTVSIRQGPPSGQANPVYSILVCILGEQTPGLGE